MPYSLTASGTNKPAYKRPYKSRRRRAEASKGKTNNANDVKFLLRVAAVIGLLLLVAWGIAVKGMKENEQAQYQSGQVAE